MMYPFNASGPLRFIQNYLYGSRPYIYQTVLLILLSMHVREMKDFVCKEKIVSLKFWIHSKLTKYILLYSLLVYETWVNTTQSSKSYFDYLFLLYYISYGYEFILIGKYIWLQIQPYQIYMTNQKNWWVSYSLKIIKFESRSACVSYKWERASYKWEWRRVSEYSFEISRMVKHYTHL
jgi:hypothetical protein